MAIFGKLALIIVTMQVAMWTVGSALDGCERSRTNVLFNTTYVKEWCDGDIVPQITRCVVKAKAGYLVACVRASDAHAQLGKDANAAVTEDDCNDLKAAVKLNKGLLNGHYYSCNDDSTEVPDIDRPAENVKLRFVTFCQTVNTHDAPKVYIYHQTLNTTWTCSAGRDRIRHSCVNMAKDKCMTAATATSTGMNPNEMMCSLLAEQGMSDIIELYEENVCKPWIIPPPPTTAAASTTAEPTSTAVPTIAVTVPQPGPSSTGPAECVTEDNADQEKEICTWEDTWTLADEQASQDAFDAAGLEPPTRESHCDNVGCYD